MGEKRSSAGINRRDALKKAGIATTVGFGGLSQVASAKREQVDDSDLERLLESEKVQAIFDELDQPTLNAGNANRLVLNLSEDAPEAETNIGIAITEIDLPYGSLYVAESETGQIDAYFTFHEKARPKHIGKYRDVPRNTSPVLLGTENGAQFRRMATDREREAVLDQVGIDDETAKVFTGTGIDGFYVDIAANDDDQGDDEIERHKVSVNANQGLTEATDINDDVTTASYHDIIDDVQEAYDDCGVKCTACASGIGSCGYCYFPCAGSPTGVGAILCVVCVKFSCETLGTVNCALCIDCLQDNGHL